MEPHLPEIAEPAGAYITISAAMPGELPRSQQILSEGIVPEEAQMPGKVYQAYPGTACAVQCAVCQRRFRSKGGLKLHK